LKIDRDEKERSPGVLWAVILVIVLTMVAGAIAWVVLRPQTAAVRTALVREVQIGGASTVLNASGYVTARRRATVSSKVTGKVV
jgi:hypothetical protein